MNAFSPREMIIGLALILAFLFIVSQVAVYLDLFGLGLSGVHPRSVPDPGTDPDLLARGDVFLSVSSSNQPEQGVAALVDEDPLTYWHISMNEVGRPAAITADFGPGRKVVIRSVRALPRSDLPAQFIRRAELVGSNDGEDWHPVADLVLREVPEEAEWRVWDLDNELAYRYWSLLILQGHEDGSRRNFYSIAELKLE